MAVPRDSHTLGNGELELIERCLAGEDKAFAKLVHRYQNMIYNLAYRFLGSPQEAEDLSQEVFLKIFRSLDTFRRASSLKTWIYRITTNMALNRLKWLRRRLRHRQVSIDVGAEEQQIPMSDMLPNGGPGPERQLHGAQIEQRLQEAINELSNEQKAVVILRDIEGLSYEEIAEMLKINIGTVKSRLARGRANVQERLKDLL